VPLLIDEIKRVRIERTLTKESVKAESAGER